MHMNRKSVYDYFIGLLALMLSLIIVIDIFVSIPQEVRLSFYYIENIIRLIFIGDYIGRLALSKDKKDFFKENIIDLLSIISIRMYLKCFKVVRLTRFIPAYMIIKICKVFVVVINIIKFKIKVRDEIRRNKFNFLLVISVIIIVIGAVIISTIEGISLEDALWWSFVTFTTVGYGDVLLKTQLGRIFAVILMIIGIGVIGVITTTITLYIVNSGRHNSADNYKNHIIEDIKEKLDNYEELSDEDIDTIIRVLSSLKKNEK